MDWTLKLWAKINPFSVKSKQASKLVVARARGKGEEGDSNGVELPFMLMQTVLELDNDDDCAVL